MFRVPSATYRLQFNQSFRFVDGRDLVPYLHDLGISDLYSSPRFMARRGSSHGYDIANPMRVNSELGTEEDFDEMALRLQHYGMGLVLDSVPNHMAASWENPWWTDVLENGPASEFAEFFDIDWHPATSKAAFLQDNRVLLPTLGDLYGNVLQNQELSLKIEDTGLLVRYYDQRLPLDPKSYGVIIERALEQNPELAELREVLDLIDKLPTRNALDAESLGARHRDQQNVKERLWRAYYANAEVKKSIDDILRILNGNKEDPRSFDPLDSILSQQAYRLAFWKIGYEEINYRRFFDINQLVGLRVEVPRVFDLRHVKSLELSGSGKVTGYRIDHVDGLYDPRSYLERLQQCVAPGGRFYIVVEKILGRNELLPPEWPVCGTTGYDFLNALNGIFIDPDGLRELQDFYSRRTGNRRPFAEICYAANKRVIEELFPGEINALGHELGKLAAQDRQARDVPLSELMQVVVEVTACLPVYRTYIRDFEIAATDRDCIERTLSLARGRTSEQRLSSGAFSFLRRVLLVDPPYYAADQKESYLRWVMRWQQFTGPVMAKGLEDTASYQYSAILSVNEVGSDPVREQPPANLAEFHEFNRRIARHWPHTMNTTSTHDTKRGEDVRARLNVLSEIPAEWERRVEEWTWWNDSKKKLVHGAAVPDASEELLIYQTLLGAWPADPDEVPGFPDRLREFLTKAAREAKVHTSWLQIDEEHEQALRGFVDAILAPDSLFLEKFQEFQKRIAWYGAINSLGQVLLKIAAPGVPDIYQGSELWNLSMVDPDNRRAVDYGQRIAMLEMLKRQEAEDRIGLLRELAQNPACSRIKLFLTYKALEFRRAHQELFLGGDYLPIQVTGACAENVCAFARSRAGEWVVAVVPRWLNRIGCELPLISSCDWRDTAVVLPAQVPAGLINVLTGASAEDRGIKAILSDFPVALLHATAVAAE